MIFQYFLLFFIVDEELCTLREKMEQDYKDISIRDLCVQRSGGCDVMFFSLDENYCTMMSKMTDAKGSKMFKDLWGKYGRKLKDEVVTMEIIFKNLWLPLCDELKLVIQQFLSGETSTEDINEYLKMFHTDYEALEQEFLLLSKVFIHGTEHHLDERKIEVKAAIHRVKKYKKLFDTREAAQVILLLQEKLGLKGDFSVVANLDKVSIAHCVCEAWLL